jgi:hypothetical protein
MILVANTGICRTSCNTSLFGSLTVPFAITGNALLSPI